MGGRSQVPFGHFLEASEEKSSQAPAPKDRYSTQAWFTRAFGAPGAADVFYSSLEAGPLQPPARKVRVEAEVLWDQAGAGIVDLRARLIELLDYCAGNPAAAASSG